MKIATVVTILMASLLMLLSLSATALLSDLGEPTADVRYEDLEAGWLLTMFCGPTLWSLIPSFPHDFAVIVNLSAFVYVCFCVAIIAVTSKGWRSISRTGAAMLTLGLGIVPSVLGAIVLQDGSASPEVAGSWLSFMLMGLLYSAAASLVLAISELPNPIRFPSLSLKQISPLPAQGR